MRQGEEANRLGIKNKKSAVSSMDTAPFARRSERARWGIPFSLVGLRKDSFAMNAREIPVYWAVWRSASTRPSRLSPALPKAPTLILFSGTPASIRALRTAFTRSALSSRFWESM